MKMGSRRSLTNEFDLSLLNDFDFSVWNARNNLAESCAKKDSQEFNEVPYEEEEVDMYDEDKNYCMETNENIMPAYGVKNVALDDAIVPLNSTQELFEEEINYIRPYMGKEFESQDEAYDFYNRYAGNTGFSIHRHTTNKYRVEPFEVIQRTFCCNRQGVRDTRAKPVEQRQRNQADIKANCNAAMVITKRFGRWVVTRVIEEHNHKLVSPSKRHNMQSLRFISSSQKQVLVNKRLAGVKTNQMMNYLTVESGGVRNIGFLPKNARNFLSTKRQLELKHGDAQAVLDYFEHQQVENPSFFLFNSS
ncbi:protein FAR1-RELATED SEQUENCE 5-like isoform X2 [Papaver somniferum]|uniref:protein FAR1-RELATED SEQUENCE 5-like isoform X2 n=1 Tax=Papaver somniferum TaxID=3469 RepID=UPI000E703C7A|nr:protein FAR1-RELATED SEQUENCE 5-like isoform X2 [Papaver somniferum]XP_026379877.1 protein FAR1-RELATED SEQUENCE 5-like isoform X2 [Papaver somniferum]